MAIARNWERNIVQESNATKDRKNHFRRMRSWSKDASAVLDRTRIMTTFDWNTRSYMKIWDFIKLIYIYICQSPRPQSRLIIVYYSETEKEKEKKNQSSNLFLRCKILLSRILRTLFLSTKGLSEPESQHSVTHKEISDNPLLLKTKGKQLGMSLNSRPLPKREKALG